MLCGVRVASVMRPVGVRPGIPGRPPRKSEFLVLDIAFVLGALALFAIVGLFVTAVSKL